MANQDWLYRVSGPILAASAAANLQGPEKKMAEGWAWLAAKSKELELLPVADAKKQFEMLDANVQESLKSLNADAAYLQDEPTLLGKAWDVVSSPLEWAWNGLGSYGETMSNVFRSAQKAGSIEEFFTKKNWDASFDGKKVFDSALERQVDAAYAPEIADIAKKVSTGMGFGEILASLSTDAEYDAFARFAKGDETIQNAIRDYDNAKISWGRSFARMFGLSPDVGKTDQGVEGKVYGFISGTADIVGDIIFDPLTYAFAPVKAIQGARLGLIELMRMEAIMSGQAGKLSVAQRAVQTFGGGTFDAAFQIPRVRKAYDTVGPLIQKFASSDEMARGKVLFEIQKIQPSMTIETIQELAKAGVKDADTARDFFKASDNAEAVMKGQVGELQGRLATHTVLTSAKNRLREAALTMTGYRSAQKLPETEVDDALKSLIDHGQSPHDALRAKQVRNFGERYSRLFERALANRSVYVGGEDELGRSLNAQSQSTVYSLARTFLPRYHAKIIANTYASTTDYAASRNILRGLYEGIADHLGIPQTGPLRMKFNAEVEKWANPRYGEDIVIDDAIAKEFSLNPGRYSPAEVNGNHLALTANQLADKVVIPNLVAIAKLSTERTLGKAVSKTIENEFISGVTDFWSALNLLPRLGIRSVFDESLMQGLVMPIAVFTQMAKGFQFAMTERIVGSAEKATKIRFIKTTKDAAGNEIKQLIAPFAEDKTVGVVVRATRRFFANPSEAELKLANSSEKGAATVIGSQLEKRKASKITGINDEDIEYLIDHVQYGHSSEIRNLGQGVTESLNNGVMGDVPSMQTARYNLNVQQINRDLGVTFGSKPTVLSKGGNDYTANFFIQLNNRVDRNGLVGRIAVENMQDPKLAVQKIAEHLRTNGAEYYSRFDRSRLVKAGTRTVEQDAMDMYLHVRKLFYNDSGVFNQKLFDKVTADGKIGSGHLTIEDYDEFMDLLPEQLMGFSEKTKSFSNIGGLISEIFDKGFQVADRQIATLTREPVHTAYVLYYRRKFKPLQEQFVQRKIAEGFSEETAKKMAAQRYSQMANESALNRMIGYIDNPNVRSVMALNARNIARYYRANEDFARRVTRVVKDPMALVRLRMGMEGLDHSGFIHEDENGDKYFSIPADEIMYPVYAAVISSLGQEPRQMMPLDFTGKLKMLTPSADPESWTPTFSGPFISMPMGVVSNILKNMGHPEIADALNKGILGKYSENKTFIDAITPTVLKRISNLATSTLDAQATSEQVASAFFKSAAFYTANGMGLTAESTLAEREQFMRDNIATARNIVAIRNLMGIWSPVAPTISETVDVPEHMLDLDMTSWRSEFRALVEAEFKKGNPAAYDDALMKWTKLFPGKLAYTVPETELETVASIKKTKQAVSWIKNNRDIVNAHRQGAAFLMPQMSGYDIDAYSFLKREGYIKSKTLDQYIEDVSNVNAENEYFDMRDNFNKQIASAATVEQARALSGQFEEQLKAYKEDKPFLKLALEHNSTGNQLKIDVLTDTRDMLNSGLVPPSATATILKKMINEYDMFKAQIDSISSQSDSSAAYKAQLRLDMQNKIVEIAGINPNAMAFYNTILKRLIEG